MTAWEAISGRVFCHVALFICAPLSLELLNVNRDHCEYFALRVLHSSNLNIKWQRILPCSPVYLRAAFLRVVQCE